MAVRNAAFESAVCKYMELTEDEAIRMLAEENEKAWKDRQAEIKYAMEEGIQKGRTEGRTEGRAEGRAEGKHNREIEIAKNLLNMLIPFDQIKKATGLSEEEIESLR